MDAPSNGTIHLPKWAWSVGVAALAHAIYVLVAVESIRSKLDVYLAVTSGQTVAINQLLQHSAASEKDRENLHRLVDDLRRELMELQRGRLDRN
jgi:hypothetical protein